MCLALETYTRSSRRHLGNIIKVKNPDLRKYKGKRFIYFESQRDFIDWVLSFNDKHEDLDYKYPYVNVLLSVRLDNSEEFAGYQINRHYGSGVTLNFQSVNVVH